MPTSREMRPELSVFEFMKSYFLFLDPILNGYGRWGRIGLLTDCKRGICYKLISFNKNLVFENQEVIF